MSKWIITLSLLLCSCLAFGQGQGDVWFFGDSVLLDFSQGAPILGPNPHMASREGSSTLSTANGRLLLYTNGWELFDSTNTPFVPWVIPNFGYLNNDYILNNSLLLPINDSIVFFGAISGSPTSGSHNAYYYARINLNANNGLGLVESSHHLLGDSLTEHFAAIRDASNEGWWILSHKTTSDKFVKWHIDQHGNISKSFQAIGGVHPPLWVYYISQLVFNPKGDRMVISSDRGRLEYYAFDRCTGDLSLLNTIQKPPVDSNGFFGLSFSPSGKLLYGSDGYFGPIGMLDGVESRLFQYELDSTNLLSTEKTIWSTRNCIDCRRAIGHHKLAPNGKVYLVQGRDDLHFDVQDTLMAINSPDSIGTACDFDPHALIVKPGKTQAGLPNIPDYRMRPWVDQVAECGPDILLCRNDSVQIGVPDTSGTLLFNWWPTTGLSDPHVAQPWASPSSSMKYYLMLIDTSIHSSCDNTIDSVRVTIVSPISSRPTAFAGADTLVCAGVAVQLGASHTNSGSWEYAWTPSTGLSNPNIANPIANITASQQYVLSAYRPSVRGGCQTYRDTVQINIFDRNSLPQNPAGPDRVICLGDTVVLGQGTGGMGLVHAWSPSSGLSDAQSATPLAWPVVTTTYFLVAQDSFFAGACAMIRDTVTVTVEQPFAHDAPQDVSFCLGECFQIGVPAVNGYGYLWSPSAGLSSPTTSMTNAQPSATTIYNLSITNPALQSANCRERRFALVATADACNHPSFIAVNGDGVAEVLDLGDHAAPVHLQVYDLSGRLVFEDLDYQNDWSAAELARGLYVYRMTVSGECGRTFSGKILVF